MADKNPSAVSRKRSPPPEEEVTSRSGPQEEEAASRATASFSSSQCQQCGHPLPSSLRLCHSCWFNEVSVISKLAMFQAKAQKQQRNESSPNDSAALRTSNAEATDLATGSSTAEAERAAGLAGLSQLGGRATTSTTPAAGEPRGGMAATASSAAVVDAQENRKDKIGGTARSAGLSALP